MYHKVFLWQQVECFAHVPSEAAYWGNQHLYGSSYNMWQWLFVPLQALSNTDTPIPAVVGVDGPIQTVSKVDASCQVDDPTELPIEGTQPLQH